jgi:hypothetical protein
VLPYFDVLESFHTAAGINLPGAWTSGWDTEFLKQNLGLPRQNVMKALSKSLVWARDAHYADEPLLQKGALNEVLFGHTDIATKAMWDDIGLRLGRCKVIMTETGKLGVVPACLMEQRDEVWIALGCGTPIVLRPQPTGAYWHVCGADIPHFQQHELLQSLSSDI